MTPFLQTGESKVRYSSQRRLKTLTESFIYRSKTLGQIMKVVDKIAPLKSTVLILGKRGVGKNCLAREIHKKKPL